MSENEIILDVVPIYKNDMYPTKDAIWHFRREIHEKSDRNYTLNTMLSDIRHKFFGYDVVIIIEKGMVIEII